MDTFGVVYVCGLGNMSQTKTKYILCNFYHLDIVLFNNSSLHICKYIVVVHCTDGWLYNETFHSCYKIFKSENVAYDEAFRNCENQGAKLTNLQNPTEQEFMRRMFTVEILCMRFILKILLTMKIAT